MLNTTEEYLNSFKTAARQVVGSIRYSHNGVIYHLPSTGGLQSFKIERTSPNGKFFGFAVAQKITIETLGPVENIQKGDRLIASVGIRDNFIGTDLPYFYVDTLDFNKVDNKTVITGYDVIGRTNNILIKDVDITYPITLKDYSALVVEKLNGALLYDAISYNLASAPNFDGTETLQTVLAAIAEASGSICYVQSGDIIRFRILSSTVLDTITPSNYFDFSVGESVTLTELASVTELNDNYVHGTEGYTQVIRENPFFDQAGDIQSLLQTIGIFTINLTATSYSLNWRGCPAYELGDCIEVIEKDGTTQKIFYLNETLTFNGGLSATSNWDIVEQERVDASPTSISKIVSKTYAKIDKLNREIILAVEETEALQSEISSIKVEAEGILAQAEFVAEKAEGALTAANNNMSVLSQQVQAAVTSEDVTIAIKQEISNGVTSVKTKTGFTFNEDGLTIDKSGSEMTTQITEDGMKVYRDNTEVLTANNKGVEAINLHATTFLTINNLTRFENYTNENDARRTGCFWLD